MIELKYELVMLVLKNDDFLLVLADWRCAAAYYLWPRQIY